LCQHRVAVNCIILGKKIKVCDTCYIRLADPKNPSQTDRKVAATHPPVLSAPSSPSVASPQSSPSTPKSSFSPSSYTSQTSTPRLTKRGSSSQNSSRKSSLNSFPVNVHTQSHQEAYYLHLYEELDALREEIKSLKSQISKAEANNQLSTDKVSKHGDTAGRGDEINRRDNENIHASEVGIQNLVNQDMIARDEKISNLTVTINELQAKEQTYKDSIGRYKKQQEQEELKHKTQTEHLQGTITLLEKEKQEMQKRMEIMLDGDRAHMLAEIDNMKKRLENEKAQEIHELEESLVADKANMKQQMEKLVKSLGEEKNAKEQMSNQIKDLMKQLDLAKARLKVNQMSDKKTNGAM